MADNIAKFARQWAILSKTSDTPLVALREGKAYVFVHGYPMTHAGFVALSMKAIFGQAIKYSGRTWEKLHQETRELCEELNLTFKPEREAFTILFGVKKHLGIKKDDLDRNKILTWVESIEDKITIARKSDEA